MSEQQKSIDQIRAEYAGRAAELQRRRHARLDELAALRTPTEVGDYLLSKMDL